MIVHQCDQISLFMNGLDDKFSHKSTPNICYLVTLADFFEKVTMLSMNDTNVWPKKSKQSLTV